MSSAVLDSSAVLAFLADERGAEIVRAAMADSSISAVNASEVISKLIDRGASSDQANAILGRLPMSIEGFHRVDAEIAGRLRAETRAHGLSLGDRACLSLGLRLGLPVLTTDRDMATPDCGVVVQLIR